MEVYRIRVYESFGDDELSGYLDDEIYFTEEAAYENCPEDIIGLGTYCEYVVVKEEIEDKDIIMDVGSKNGYPAGALSNFSPHPFELDGIKCNSMEGFLQGLKFESKEMQEYVCSLVGYAAKKKGRNKNWQEKQTLYWRGNPIKRDSEEYQNLLNRAYNAMYENTKFRAALEASKGATLTHSIGKNKKNETVLTTQEFCSRLTYLRDKGKLPVNEQLNLF